MDVIETVDEHCPHEDCIYRMHLMFGTNFCAYMLVTNEPRGCSISQCDKCKRGSKRVVLDGATLNYRWILTDEDD